MEKDRKRNITRKRLFYFLDNGYLHGLRYLGQRCGFKGKLFWLIAVLISAWQMSRILLLTYENFNDDALSIQIDTLNLHWNHTFPAVSICITKGRSTNKIRDFLTDYWAKNNIQPPKRSMNYIKLIQSYLFQNPNQPIDLFDQYCETQNNSCGMNLKILQRMFLPYSCEDFMFNVTYLGVTYDNCEDLFKFHETEMGFCFITNSIRSYNLDASKLPLKYNRVNFDRTLKFSYKDLEASLFMLYVHSPEDLPYFNANSFTLRKSDAHLTYFFNTIEVKNSKEIETISIKKRKCRFPFELIEEINSAYSFSTCFLNLRIKSEIKECNCTIHTSPSKFENIYCDYEGLKCIRSSSINAITKELHYQKETQCLQSCVEMDIINVGEIENLYDSKGQPASVTIEVINAPLLRYNRIVAKSYLDLVVSVGGVIGLFFGASLLTIFQFFYIWCFRRF